MGKLLYYDGSIAVCDFEVGERSDEKAVRLLLGADASAPNPEKHVRPLLECWGMPVRFSTLLLDDREKAAIFARADLRKLKSLGITIEDGSIAPVMEFVTSSTLRLVASVPQTTRQVGEVALFLQYLAKLYLLANGDRRHASMLPDIKMGTYELAFDADMPDLFFFALTNCILPVPATFDINKAEPSQKDGYTKIPVKISYKGMLRFPNDKNGLFVLPADEFELKRLAASYLLASLVNYCSTTPFDVDPETLGIMRSSRNTFASTLADFLIEGKVGACPHCGRPVFMPRKSSKPFCGQAHQTRYNEKARQMLNRGASVDEVSDAFPHIRYGTISGWLPMKGPKS